MQRVKLFRGHTVEEVERVVNGWLDTENVVATTVSLSEDDVGLTLVVLYSSA